MHETLRRSSLGESRRARGSTWSWRCAPTTRLGGHIMQGHVDGVGRVAGVAEDGFSRVVTIAVAGDLLRYVVEKGSIAVDGVSLTVARVDDDGFDVALIPETLERTNLGAPSRAGP